MAFCLGHGRLHKATLNGSILSHRFTVFPISLINNNNNEEKQWRTDTDAYVVKRFSKDIVHFSVRMLFDTLLCCERPFLLFAFFVKFSRIWQTHCYFVCLHTLMYINKIECHRNFFLFPDSGPFNEKIIIYIQFISISECVVRAQSNSLQEKNWEMPQNIFGSAKKTEPESEWGE